MFGISIYYASTTCALKNPPPIPCLPAGRRHPLQNKIPQDVYLAGFIDYPENNIPGIY
jgi:hypothetical protein